MHTTWKPSDQLISILRGCDIDSDILNSAIYHPLVITSSKSEIDLNKDFTRKVVEQNISWNNFASHPKSLFFDQGTYLRKDWRPKEATINLILDELKLIGRVEIAEYRLSFLRVYDGQKLNAWDSLFIRFVLDVGSEYREIITKYDQPSDDKYPEHQRIINKITIKNIINRLLEFTYITPYFNKPLDDSWRPSDWVIKKLENEFNLNKRFILNETLIRRPFISFQLSKGKVIDDYDVLYFAWVSERHSKYHRLLIEEKERHEKNS